MHLNSGIYICSLKLNLKYISDYHSPFTEMTALVQKGLIV